ncbi:hypothetical protein [Actinomadura alba]|uniref:WD40 repeat domain-containing protein n=1 Tax=Actinomadura alba TaxID=406431 RepID=A0ABR7LVY5_9ACTN|nr:hypothetical protein [Actinomadura alba]MBC6468625.1 hypothetical protein [Actinomadura alba]
MKSVFHQKIRVWDLDTGARLRVLGRQAEEAWGIGISENGRIVTALDGDGVTLVWELDWEYDFA